MSQTRKQLAQQAIATAMKVRKEAGFSLHAPINIFDFSERLGVSVLFQDIPSMEGVYTSDAKPRPVIIVSSLRPAGRKALTCGHELGHHVFGHGTQWDELVDSRSQARRFEPEEFLVDVFSASLQMPKLAVAHAFSKRSVDPMTCTTEDIYAMSTLFGVSFGGFVTHMEKSLNLIDMRRASELTNVQPKQLRKSILGSTCPQNLIVVDKHWRDRAVDVEVGDSVILPPQIQLEGTNASLCESSDSRSVLTAERPGICRVIQPDTEDWSVFVRVSRKNYVGRATFRFDEETDDNI